MRALAIAGVTACAVLLALPAGGQWLNYPTAGVPRLPDGRPNLAAPAPRAADGKPDLSGLWETDAAGGSVAPVAGGALLPPEFLDGAARLKGGLPYRPWALELRNARQAENGNGNPDGQCLPLTILQLHSHPFPRRIVQASGIVVILYEKNIDYRIEITVDDAKAYTAPWTVKINQHIKLDTELLEYVCLENEKSRVHLVGK